jgi:hypothetical protein
MLSRLHEVRAGNRIPQSKRPRRLALEALEDRRLLASATLRNDPGDGTVFLTTDGYGSFGANVGVEHSDAFYDPVDGAIPLDRMGTTGESGVAIGFDGQARTFLTSGNIEGSGGLPQVDVNQTSLTTSFSSFTFNGLNFDLVQSLTNVVDAQSNQIGSLLTQQYLITNATGQVQTFDMLRYLNGDLLFDGTTDDLAGRFVDPTRDVLYQLDRTLGFRNAETLIGISALGGQVVDTSIYRIDEVPELANEMILGLDPDNRIAEDNDDSGETDFPYDVSVVYRNQYELEPGEQARYTTSTMWGVIPIDLVVLPDLGGISGTKWDDRDGDGFQDTNEPGLSGWQIYIDDNANGMLDAGERETTTDENGDYQFEDLVPATYIVREVLQQDWEQTFPDPITENGEHEVEVGFEEVVEDIDFGNVAPRISGAKFHDLDGNGRRAPDEPPLNGWQIYLDLNNNGVLDAGEPSDITDDDGRYGFFDLASGTYVVREVNQTGWTQTLPATGAYTIDYTENTVVEDQDFGNIKLGGISGFKWHDLDADGVRESGEPGLGGWTIYLDLNNSGTLDPGEPRDVTVADGSYEFGLVDPLVYTVAEVPKTNWEQTFPAGGTHQVNLIGGQNVENINFGNKGFASISGVKYNDLNDDGVRDPDEPGLRGFYIYVDVNRDGTPGVGEPAARTATDGSYTISRLEPGSYTVREVVSPGWRQTAPAGDVYNVSVFAGQSLSGLDFGNYGMVDWGDAPAIYPTLAADDGASHDIVPGFHLGLGSAGVIRVDGEVEGQPSAAALGDDLTGIDDENGILGLGTPLVAGSTETITILAPVAQATVLGKLQGWIDFNADGDWADPGEQILYDAIIPSGASDFTFFVPGDAAGGPTYARFRISYEFGLPPVGPANSGEVEDYLVNISSAANPFGADAPILGPIDDVSFDNIDLAGPTELLSVTATQTGIFTAIASFVDPLGNIDMAVFDSDGNWLGESFTTGNEERVDFESTAGETYYVQLYGSNPAVDLRFLNMISINSPVTVVGTPRGDSVELNAPDASLGTTCEDCVELIVNGVPYMFDAGTEFIFNGNEGEDSLVVNSNGFEDRVRFRTGSVELGNPAFDLSATSIEDAQVDTADGQDRAWFFHLPGDDQVEVSPEVAQRTHPDYLQKVTGAEIVLAYSDAADNDTASITGTPRSDVFIGNETFSVLRNGGYHFYVQSFPDVDVDAGVGMDVATISDSSGNDIAAANRHVSYMDASTFRIDALNFYRTNFVSTTGDDSANFVGTAGEDLYVTKPEGSYLRTGNNFYYAQNFPRVVANGLAGEDRAVYYGSDSSDTFISRALDSTIVGTGYYARGLGFELNGAIAGVEDRAVFFDTSGQERYLARPEYAYMQGDSFFNYGRGFGATVGIATVGGGDEAFMIDGPGNDTFGAADDLFYLIGSDDYYNRGEGFDKVYAIGENGGINKVDVGAITFDLVLIGDWI